MGNSIKIKNYHSILDLKTTEKEIKLIKDSFQINLANALELTRVSAPIFVSNKSGINDYLSGKEMPVSFSTKDGEKIEIVQSLAKWKRYALKKYNLSGLYTDMNAIRPNEEVDNIHSLYVDQWDWEKVIKKEDRNINFLKSVVDKIYSAFYKTYQSLIDRHNELDQSLPANVTYITSEELLALYPDLSSKERENEYCKIHKVVFVIGIGRNLKNGLPHDLRASDYDDWDLNGDLLLWFDTLGIAFELSSMGIRVDSKSLKDQLEAKNETYKLDYPYHKAVMNNEYPLTIGGGIGQSRLCMYLLKKVHIGEVQASYWPDDMIDEFIKLNVHLL